MAGFSVVVCGGGIAAVEALLRLRRLAGDRIAITLICPDEALVYRPLAVCEPFTGEPAPRYLLARIAADVGATWLPDSLDWVDRAHRTVHTAAGRVVGYDALLLAVGGRQLPSSPHTDVFTGRDGGAGFRAILDGIDRGEIGRLAFVLPPGPTWPLPLFELALLTAHHARAVGRPVRLHLVLPTAQPAQALGKPAGDVISGLLHDAGVVLHSAWSAGVPASRRLVIEPRGTVLRPDRIVTLPAIGGPNVRGIPGAVLDGFLPVDAYCRVRDAGGSVFAAGDATDLTVKHGSVGAQQADTAAAGIAHVAGLAPAPEPVRAVVRGTLLTGAAPLYVSARLVGGQGWQGTVHDTPPWPAGDKIVAEELGPYLAGLRG